MLLQFVLATGFFFSEPNIFVARFGNPATVYMLIVFKRGCALSVIDSKHVALVGTKEIITVNDVGLYEKIVITVSKKIPRNRLL